MYNSDSDSDSDSDWVWEYNFIQTAFRGVASATIIDIDNKIVYLHFDDITDENGRVVDVSTVNLIDPVDDEEYEFEQDNGIPVITDVKYFIPFVNHISTIEKIRGIKINTNLEGGGSLIL